MPTTLGSLPRRKRLLGPTGAHAFGRIEPVRGVRRRRSIWVDTPPSWAPAARRGSEEVRSDRDRIDCHAAALSGLAILCAAPQAHGIRSSMREAGQRLTSFMSTSAK